MIGARKCVSSITKRGFILLGDGRRHNIVGRQQELWGPQTKETPRLICCVTLLKILKLAGLSFLIDSSGKNTYMEELFYLFIYLLIHFLGQIASAIHILNANYTNKNDFLPSFIHMQWIKEKQKGM